MVYNMGFIISIPLGIILGFIAYRISLRSQTLGYVVGLLPYSVLFFLTFEDREMWGHYRAIAFFATVIASVFCFVSRKLSERKNGELNSNH